MTSHKADSSAASWPVQDLYAFSACALAGLIQIYTQEDTPAGNTEFNLVRFDIAVDDVVDRLYMPLSIDHIAD